MSWLYHFAARYSHILHQRPVIGGALLLVGLVVGGIVAIGICRAVIALLVEGFEALRDGVERGSEALSSVLVSSVSGLLRLFGRLLVVVLWYASRPLVFVWDWLRDASVMALDSASAAIDRARQERRLWRESGIPTWREFRRRFDSTDEPQWEEPERPAPGGGGWKAFADACALLGLPDDGSFTQTALNAAHRARMQKAHPDKGGAPGLAARLNAARDLIRKHKGWD